MFDNTGADAETITLELEDGQTGANQWPFYLAELVNTNSSLAKIGVLDSNGNINPVQSAQNNNVYISSEEEFSFQIDIEMSPNPPGESLTTDLFINDDWGTGYCAEVTVTNNPQSASDWTVLLPSEATVRSMSSATYTHDVDDEHAQAVS